MYGAVRIGVIIKKKHHSALLSSRNPHFVNATPQMQVYLVACKNSFYLGRLF